MRIIERSRSVGLAGLVTALFLFLSPLAAAGVGGPGGLPVSGDDWTTSPRTSGPVSSGPGFVVEVEAQDLAEVLATLEGRGSVGIEGTSKGTIRVVLSGSYRLSLDADQVARGSIVLSYQGERGRGRLLQRGDRLILIQR